MLKHKRIILALLVVATAAASLPIARVAAQAVTEAYTADTVMKPGMIVSLKNKTKVEPLTNDQVSSMEGVVVSPSDAPVTLSSTTGSTTQAYVASSGHYPVLVSTQNGNIKAGDYITISTLQGIGMEADSSQSLVLGKALADFTPTNATSTAKLNGRHGQSRSVSIGLIPVDISVTRNPMYDGGSYVPAFMVKIGSSIAGKPVNPMRIYISLATLLISAIVAGSILYAGVRNTLISIGRNPLAKQSIMRGMTSVIMTSVIILVLGMGSVYMLLRL